jgi:(1->4)-alpha-D-glucan 1-alpha-D-glucosylmutase
LRFRRRNAALFLHGEYEPLRTEGTDTDRLVAFARCQGSQAAIVAVPRLMSEKVLTSADADPREMWDDTRVVLPAHLADRGFRNLFTGRSLQPAEGHLPARAIFRACPVAVLVAVTA